jgi:hypothetical protein
MNVGDTSGLVRQLLFLAIIQLLLVEAMQVVLWVERISKRLGGQLASNNITKKIMDKVSYTVQSFFDDPQFSNALGNAMTVPIPPSSATSTVESYICIRGSFLGNGRECPTPPTTHSSTIYSRFRKGLEDFLGKCRMRLC